MSNLDGIFDNLAFLKSRKSNNNSTSNKKRKWNDNWDGWLKDNYGKLNAAEVAEKLIVSKTSVLLAADRLGLVEGN